MCACVGSNTLVGGSKRKNGIAENGMADGDGKLRRTRHQRAYSPAKYFSPLTHYHRSRARFENPQNPRGLTHTQVRAHTALWHNAKWLPMRLDLLTG